MLFSLAAACCQDAPLSIRDRPSGELSPGPVPQLNAAKPAASPYFCLVSQRTAEGQYRYGRLSLRMPASAIAPDGATRRLVYREEAAGEAPVLVANCTIPATDKALAVAQRLLFIDAKARVERGGNEADVATPQSCPDTGCVVLGTLVVTAPPYSGSGWGSGGGGGGDCWACDDSAMQYYGGGGGDSGTGEEPDPGWEEQFVPVEGEGACPDCGERKPSDEQMESIKAAIERVQCESMKTVLLERLPYMQVFSEQPPEYADPSNPLKEVASHMKGVIYIWEGLWREDGETVRSQSQFLETLVHEAAHAWWTFYQGYSDGRTTHHANWQQTMAECGYPNAR